jgi:hypothetical protein
LSLDKVAFVIFDLSDLSYRLYFRSNGWTVRTLKSVEQTLRGSRLIALHRAPKSKRWRNRPKSSICTRPGIAIKDIMLVRTLNDCAILIISQNKAPCSRHLFEPAWTIAGAETERPGMNRAFHVWLFLLLALRMSLIAMLVGSLRMLFGAVRVLLALGVVALAVMFGGGTMCLGSIFVMFGSLVVFFFGHGILVGC